jgi:hypothetical protein
MGGALGARLNAGLATDASRRVQYENRVQYALLIQCAMERYRSTSAHGFSLGRDRPSDHPLNSVLWVQS